MNRLPLEVFSKEPDHDLLRTADPKLQRGTACPRSSETGTAIPRAPTLMDTLSRVAALANDKTHRAKHARLRIRTLCASERRGLLSPRRLCRRVEIQFLITMRRDGHAGRRAAASQASDDMVPEIGYWLGAECGAQATEAVRACADGLRLHRAWARSASGGAARNQPVIASHFAENAGSQ